MDMDMMIFLFNNIIWMIFFYMFSKEKRDISELPKVEIKKMFGGKKKTQTELTDLTDVSLNEIIKK